MNWLEETHTRFWEVMVRPNLPHTMLRELNLDLPAHVNKIREAAAVVAGNRKIIWRALGFRA